MPPTREIAATTAVHFRVRAHCLDERRPATTPVADVAGVALPDYPKGAALRGLAARRDGIDGGTLEQAVAEGALVRAPSLRGTTHVFAERDLAVFTLGALPTPGDEEATRAALGSAWPVFEQLDVPAAGALHRVADEIVDVVADGQGRSKGEISEALHGRLPAGWEPWCARCRAHHVPDLLFRLAAITAGLRFADGEARLVPGPGPRPDLDRHGVARAELVRRFLRAYAPATPQAFAEWCGLGPAEAKASFAALGDEIVPVQLDRRRAHALAGDVARLEDPPPVRGVRLVPAGDAFLHQRDRATLVSDPARRKALWRPVGAPGLVLLDGLPAGVWRHKQARQRLLVTVDPWTDQLEPRRSELDEEAAVLASTHNLGPDRVEVELST